MFIFLNNRWIDLRYFEGFTRNEKSHPEGQLFFVGAQGFEPWTPCSQSRCATGLRYAPNLFSPSILDFRFRTLNPPDLNRDALPSCATYLFPVFWTPGFEP